MAPSRTDTNRGQPVESCLKDGDGAAPDIQSFLASTLSVPGGGGKVQLVWSVADADSLRIESDQPDAPGDVAGNTVEVDVRADTTFTLVAENEGGRSELALTVEVNSIGEPDILVQFGSTASDSVADLAVQSDGVLYVVGYTSGDTDGKNSGDIDAFLTKFSSSAERYWTRQLGTDTSDRAKSVAVADDGSIYIAGTTYGVLEPGSPDDDTASCFLARYFDDGALDWLRQVDGRGLQRGRVWVGPLSLQRGRWRNLHHRVLVGRRTWVVEKRRFRVQRRCDGLCCGSR